MSKLMWIAGILLIAAGIALGLMVFVSTASVVGWGITLDLAALLLVGGLVNLGLGSVISALQSAPRTMSVEAPTAIAPAAPIPEFGRRPAEAVPAAAVAAAPSVVAARDTMEVSEPTRQTIKALEQARQKIEQAFEPKPAAQPAEAPVSESESAAAEEPVAEEAAAEEEAPAEEEVAGEDAIEEGQLYVVEERVIRMRPARILSDGTVEAETEEGWMRFENLEHLDEYLDAIAPARA